LTFRFFSVRGLKAAHAFELALERPVAVERGAEDEFHRAKLSESIARQPYLAVSASADALEELVIADGRWLG
jgi:hypothetical protein